MCLLRSNLRYSYEPEAEYVDGVIESGFGENDLPAWQEAIYFWLSNTHNNGVCV